MVQALWHGAMPTLTLDEHNSSTNPLNNQDKNYFITVNFKCVKTSQLLTDFFSPEIIVTGQTKGARGESQSIARGWHIFLK